MVSTIWLRSKARSIDVISQIEWAWSYPVDFCLSSSDFEDFIWFLNITCCASSLSEVLLYFLRGFRVAVRAISAQWTVRRYACVYASATYVSPVAKQNYNPFFRCTSLCQIDNAEFLKLERIFAILWRRDIQNFKLSCYTSFLPCCIAYVNSRFGIFYIDIDSICIEFSTLWIRNCFQF